MDEHNRALGVHGGGWPLQSAGREWVVTPITQGSKAQFTSWIHSRIRTAAAQSRIENPDLYQDMLAAANAQIASGRYGWGREGWAEFLQTPEGMQQILLLLLRQKHPEAMPDDAERLLNEHPEDVGRAIGFAIASPKATSPEKNPGESR